jgi:DNA-binding response OmpR family regulator
MTEQSAKLSSATTLHGARVLIVEDDVLLLMELETILRDAGAEIAAGCRTVREGLVAAGRCDVAAAILDVRVGRETIAPVARQLADCGTPFIFYTGQVENDPQLAEWAGYTVLSKPARASAIVGALAEVLQRS